MPFLYPYFKKTTMAVLLLGTVLSPVYGFAADSLSDTLSPRAEVSVKGGTDRSVLTTEFWAPLAQQSGRVVYTDLRLMGDDDDNREGNLGLGYRQVTGWSDSVLGGHLWIDRRRTEHNSTFHQVTLGVESLGKVIDLRANGYIPLNGANVAATPNMGSSSPYLAGSGIFYDTNGSVSETPQYGVDAELGYRIPVLQKYTDTIRIYGGGYSFFRGGTDSTTGYRTRVEAVINPVLSIGARFQHDAPRGDQGFLEATLRFPFAAKKMYQQKGLYGRLDESPERDVDIVTARKVDTGLRKPVINPNSGEAQRVLYVDNSNAGDAGDGTIERPFNNLSAAQINLKANDIIYVKAGNGTTARMDQGITISQSNVQLIGSGSAFAYQGYTFFNAGTAPVITNTQTDGDGIIVAASNGLVTGVTVDGAQRSGIRISAADGNNLDNITISNNTVANSVGYAGIVVAAVNGGNINTIDISNNITRNNSISAGILFTVDNNSTLINNAIIRNNTVSNNGGNSVTLNIFTGAQINNVLIDNNVVTNNTGNGISMQVEGGRVGTANFTHNSSVANTINGIAIYVRSNGSLNTYNLIDNTVIGNGTVGARIFAGTGGFITNATMQNLTANNNGLYGALVSSGDAGTQIGNLSLSNISASNNANSGVRISGTGGVINSAVISNITATGNTGSGVDIGLVQSTIGNLGVSGITTIGNTVSGFVTSMSTQAAIGQLNLSDVFSRSNGAVGVNISTNTSSTITNTNVSNIVSNNNTQYGVNIRADSGAVLSNVNVSNATLNNNITGGLNQNLNTGGIITNSTLSFITANNNGQQGINTFVNTGSQISNLNVLNNSLAGNATNALYTRVSGVSSVITTANITGNTVTGTGTHGINVQADTSGVLNTVTVSGNDLSSNTGRGLSSITQTNGQINTFNILNNNANSNGSFGMYVGAQSNSQMNNVLINGNITGANSAAGIYLNATGTLGVIANAIISNNISNGNTTSVGRGIQVQNDTSSSITATLFHNTATSNISNGLLIVKAGTGTFAVDAGTGAVGTGQNRIFNNTGTEVRVDGYAFVAQKNYWGGGDLVVGEKTLNGGATVDSAGFLTVDPGP